MDLGIYSFFFTRACNETGPPDPVSSLPGSRGPGRDKGQPDSRFVLPTPTAGIGADVVAKRLQEGSQLILGYMHDLPRILRAAILLATVNGVFDGLVKNRFPDARTDEHVQNNMFLTSNGYGRR